MSPRFHSSSMKAPAPTGLEPNSSPSASTALRGRMEAENIASVDRNGAEGWSSLMTTVWSSGVSIAGMILYMLAITESSRSRSRSRLNFTSSAVIGLPSLNLRPCLRVKV